LWKAVTDVDNRMLIGRLFQDLTEATENADRKQNNSKESQGSKPVVDKLQLSFS